MSADDAAAWKRTVCMRRGGVRFCSGTGRTVPFPGVGRATQPRCEPSDIAQVVALRLVAEMAHGHIVDQPLAQRADRANRGKLVHRSTPQVEEVERVCLRPAPLNPRTELAILILHHRQSHSRAAGSCNGQSVHSGQRNLGRPATTLASSKAAVGQGALVFAVLVPFDLVIFLGTGGADD